MEILYYFALFVAIVASVLCITGHINNWICLMVMKENYVDNKWFGRFFHLTIATLGWITVLALK